MNWLASNWFWLALVLGMFAMHFFGHGRHGYSGHHHGGTDEPDRYRGGPDDRPGSSLDKEASSSGHAGHGDDARATGHRHRHGCC
jgi:hypothetical protein